MSLRLRAILITGISLLVLWTAAAAWMMRGVHANLDQTLDGRLAMSARMVSVLLERTTLAPTATGAGADLSEAMQVSGKDGIACEIRSLQGEILARTGAGPHSEFELLPTGFSTQEVQGHLWRVYVLRANGYQISTADRIDQRNTLIQELLSVAGVPFFIALLGGLAALWIGIGRSLAPLKALSQQLRNKHEDDTAPITVNHSPTELRPVLDAMNGLLNRLARTLSGQRAFTDAAAHELRTPLTVIDTHLQVAQLSEGEEVATSLANANIGVKRLRRTLDQMMTLARAQAPIDDADRCTSIATAVHHALAQWDTDERLRLSLTVQGQDCGTLIPKSMLETMIRNLVDNAMRYSPNDTLIDIAVQFDQQAHHCLISVLDRGPGITTEQATQIGQRFWRGDQGRKSKEGAGLGLSIVRAITERFGGSLDLRSREGGGLIVTLSLPIASG
jgi:two-component system sensor histidine kinase QseC